MEKNPREIALDILLDIEKNKIFSNTAMMVERAANVIKIKNNAPQNRPPIIWLNIFGRVTKTSPTP